MSNIKIDCNKLLGYRLLANDDAARGTLNAKIGAKGGIKFGAKTGTKSPLSAKIGLKDGPKSANVIA